MFRSSSRQPVQVAPVAPPIAVMSSSQPIYIPAPQMSSSKHGGNTMNNQPYTILVGSGSGSRRAPIEIVVDHHRGGSSRREDPPVQPLTSHKTLRRYSSSSHYHHHSEKPTIIINAPTSSSSSSKHHHRSLSASASSAPRSDVATYGGSVYGETRSSSSSSKAHASSSHDSHGYGHSDKREASSSRHNNNNNNNNNSTAQHTRHRTYSNSGDYLRPPPPLTTSQPIKAPAPSPQKHARFAALPQSVPVQPVSLPPVMVPSHHPSSSMPIQVSSSLPTSMSSSRPHGYGHHRSSHSHDMTVYANRPSPPRHLPPHGWFNRRGDEYIVERGQIRKADSVTKWDPMFNEYPDPGTGWMDHEKRFIPASGGILKH